MKSVSDKPEIRGWCPGALRPMMSGDGLVVRIRPRIGRLSRDQMRGIAALSKELGNGLIDLSARANLQLRGVADGNHSALIQGLSDLGLIDTSAEVESRRNIVVTPFWAKGDGVEDLAEQLATALSAPDAAETPAKFGFAVDCGASPVLRDVSADIRIERNSVGALLVRADGSDLGVTVGSTTAIATAMDLARWFLASGGAPEGRGRMRSHLSRAALPDHFVQTKAACGDSGPAPAPGPVATGCLVGFEFGQMQARTLSDLADFGAVRVTPWRLLLVENLDAAPNLAGLITRPDNPGLRVAACTGAPGCPQALGPTRGLARLLSPLLPKDASLHLSGCAKGCAHPSAAPATLVARVDGTYDLIRNGTASDVPSRVGLSPETLVANPILLTE